LPTDCTRTNICASTSTLCDKQKFLLPSQCLWPNRECLLSICCCCNISLLCTALLARICFCIVNNLCLQNVYPPSIRNDPLQYFDIDECKKQMIYEVSIYIVHILHNITLLAGC